MEEQNATQQLPPISIADALNASMKTMSTLVAKYTAAVQAAAKPLNGEAKVQVNANSIDGGTEDRT